jgi:hypothetical protein
MSRKSAVKKFKPSSSSTFCDNKLPWCQICGGLCAFLLALQVVVVACGLFVWPAAGGGGGAVGNNSLKKGEYKGREVAGVLRRVADDVTIMVGSSAQAAAAGKRNEDFLERHGVKYR